MTAFSAFTTLWPHGSPGDAAIVRWAAAHPVAANLIEIAGLWRPFQHPLFLASAALLSLGTAACAVERTRWAFTLFRGKHSIPGTVTDGIPWGSYAALMPAPKPLDLPDLARRLSSGGLKWSATPAGLIGYSRPLSVFASPLFHFALLGIFVCMAFSSLVRAESYLDVAVGEVKVSEPGAYREGSTSGPLFAGHQQLSLEVQAIARDHVPDEVGLSVGDAPLVRLYSEQGSVLASDYVYPNNPLRWRNFTVHRRDTGPALMATIRSQDGIEESFYAYFNRSAATSLGIDSQRLTILDSASSKEYVLELGPAGEGRVRAAVVSPPELAAEAVAVSVGDTISLPFGGTLVLDELMGYATLTIVEDPSGAWVVGSLLIACMSVAPALLFPARFVYLLPIQREGEPQMAVVVQAQRVDPAFQAIVLRDLRRTMAEEPS